MSSAETTVEAEYQTSLGYHGLMEPINAVALESGGVWHIYTGSQFQTRFVGMTAAALGVDAKMLSITKLILEQVLDVVWSLMDQLLRLWRLNK